MAESTDYVADFPSEIIREGRVQVLVPNLKAYGVTPSDYAPSKAPVFYNPVMEFNRDLSVLALQAYQHMVGHEVSICEPLTSQGIRGIRYAAEIEEVSNVLLGDISTRACQLAQHNIELNHLETKITLKHSDANRTLCNNASPKKRFDIIDIDPFGTPVPYLDSAFRALKNRGLIAATATDLAPLCGVHAKACLRKYGGKPLRAEYCHELAVRLLCGYMAVTAAKQDIGIQILFSHSSDHYIRVYAQISYGAKKADDNLKSMGYILHCFNCMHREITHQPFGCPTCQECGTKMDYAGPLWTGDIAGAAFVGQIIVENQKAPFRNSAKIAKRLSLIEVEPAMPPAYYVIDKLSGKLNLPAPSNQTFIEALKKAGYHAVATHFNPRGIKTDAPTLTMHKVLRELTSNQQA
ncbi:MAG: tRNA (guanine(10)-N(2))-dimethyltransferase [Nitrososphaerota archaeon]|jgi:tRNA (guanine26-N2/guanine27-N2)-dimethyltransferase|nr:tRNA (guanine(10)-N(2))-dimethyltransferase [Nitrososphaerota archaeon]